MVKQHRRNYHNVWHSDLLHTFQADTPYFCFSLFCAPCASYLLRKRALHNDMSRYVVVPDIGLVVADVVRVTARSFVLLLRFVAVSEIQ